ncbi:MAG: T9SS type A sorting domain-containing protein [Bacteroidota bacterium]
MFDYYKSMISVEQQTLTTSFYSDFPSAVRFTVYPHQESAHQGRLFIELLPYKLETSEITLSDSKGKLILQHQPQEGANFIVRNLKAGTYFFEINDGFFHQVKELRIPA